MQSAGQIPAQRDAHLWRKGTSGNPRGSESKAARLARRDAIIAGWCEPYGGLASLKPAEVHLLIEAADLAMRPRPRREEDHCRRVNAISKILAQVGLCDKRRRREPPPAEQVGDLVVAKIGPCVERSK